MKIPFYNPIVIENVKLKLKEYKETNAGIIDTAIIVDLESLGTTPNAVVFNLAAVFFSLDPSKQSILENEVNDRHIEFHFNPTQQILLGRTIDPSTVEWWEHSSRKEALNDILSIPITEFITGMNLFHQWIKNKKEAHGCRVFYRGQDFDGPIIDSLLKSAGIEKQWVRGDAPRDIRTFIDAKLGTSTGYVAGIPKSQSHISHTALGDCINDARAMQFAYYLNEQDPNID